MNSPVDESTLRAKPKAKKIIIPIIAALLAICCASAILLLVLGNNKSSKIIKDGVAQYTVVCPDSCSEEFSLAVSELIDRIKTTTGVELNCIKAADATDTNTNYVFIGATGSAESGEAIASLSGNEDAYTITKSGNHVVITGHFDTATIEAVKYVRDNLIESGYSAGSQTLTLKSYQFEGTVALPAAFEVSELSRYTIIYSDSVEGNREAAEKVQKRIQEYTKTSLKVGKDTETPESAYEILIGKTNRHISQKCYQGKTYLMKYKLVVEKGQLQIVGGGPYSAKLGGYELAGKLLDKNASLPTGTHAETDIATENIPHSEGTDVRIMTANVLTDEAVTESTRDSYPIPAERAEILAKILVDYTPDFVGVQEMSAGFVKPVQELLKIVKETYGLDYSLILTEFNGKSNHCPIIYRADKFKLDHQDLTTAYYYPNGTPGSGNWGNWYDNATAWAKFTSLTDSSVEIALLTSHWHWETEKEAGTSPKQEVDAETMRDVVEYIRETYPNAKIFCTGDFNSHRFSGKYFRDFLEDINGVVAGDIARANDVFVTSFQHQGQYIDHIIGARGTFDVLLHRGTKNASSTLTDHQPVFADIKFIK